MSREWIFDAKCANSDYDLGWWFERDQFPRAKMICNLCIVKEPCLTYAIENDEEYAIWGGMAYTDRCREAARREESKKKGSK